MKKKIVPVLVVLALVTVGIGSYFLGQQSNSPVVETPPAQSSTPEAKPDVTPIATPSSEPTPETIVPEPEKEPEEELVAENPDYFEDMNRRWIMWPIMDINVYAEPTETSEVVSVNPKGLTILVKAIGHGSYGDWYYIAGCVKGIEYKGYVQSQYLSMEEVEMDSEEQQPVQQKPSSNVQKPSSDAQKPVEQKPSNEVQKPVEQKPSSDVQNQSGNIPGAMSWEDFASEISHVELTEEQKEADRKATQEAVDRTQGTLHPN